MGVQDIGCLKWAPKGYGVVRSYSGRCLYYQDTYPIRKNFRMSEFNTSKTFPYGIMEKLVDQLQKMLDILGSPIVITSGYRPTSGPHASGLAADIWVPYRTFIDVAQAAYDSGFQRIEVLKDPGISYWNQMRVGGYIHVDVYDGSGNSTAGTMYDCPTCSSLPYYPWYAWGIHGSGWATASPNTFNQLMINLKSDSVAN